MSRGSELLPTLVRAWMPFSWNTYRFGAARPRTNYRIIELSMACERSRQQSKAIVMAHPPGYRHEEDTKQLMTNTSHRCRIRTKKRKHEIRSNVFKCLFNWSRRRKTLRRLARPNVAVKATTILGYLGLLHWLLWLIAIHRVVEMIQARDSPIVSSMIMARQVPCTFCTTFSTFVLCGLPLSLK